MCVDTKQARRIAHRPKPKAIRRYLLQSKTAVCISTKWIESICRRTETYVTGALFSNFYRFECNIVKQLLF